MSDICERLRRWPISTDAAPASDLMDEAAGEIERLLAACESYAHSSAVAFREIAKLCEAIRRLAGQDATLSVCDGKVTVEMDGTLTDAERGAIELAAGDYLYHQDAGGRAQHIRETMLGLLERTT